MTRALTTTIAWIDALYRRRRLVTAFLAGVAFAALRATRSSFVEYTVIDFAPQSQSQSQQSKPSVSDHFDYYKDEDNIGILSTKDPSYFRAYQEEIDSLNDETRCKRYGFQLKSNGNSNGPAALRQKPRRIFFGSLVAAESWELFEIVAAETYGIYEGFVLVESNRTQNFSARNLTHYNKKEKHEEIIEKMFGIPPQNTKIRLYVNEDPKLINLPREHAQRNDIVNGWKDLGMQPDDVAILSDMDEVLTRDFLRAIQVCSVIDEIDYSSHKCQPDKMGLRAVTQVYESSPECITEHRKWFHPSVFVGHCIEGIGNTTIHKPSPRHVNNVRLPGWGQHDWNASNPYTPLSDGGDFRAPGAARSVKLKMVENQETKRHYNDYTAFHFHNFFTDGKTIRFKYRTYGHPVKNAYSLQLEDLHKDLGLVVHCVRNERDPTDSKYKRVRGGFESLDPFTPIYFQDADYRRRRQEFVHDMFIADDAQRNKTAKET